MDTKTLRKWHRTLSLFFSLALLTSSASGIIHQIMSRTQAPPPKAKPSDSVEFRSIRVSIPEALAKLDIGDAVVEAVSLRGLAGVPWYQFTVQDKEKPVYMNAVSGEVDAQADEVYAKQIASLYLGGAEVRQTGYLKEFNKEYLNIFRILPVYRFDADDKEQTRVYVSTMTGSVTRDTNNRKQLEAAIFSNAHKFMFIQNKDIRDATLIFMTAGVFVSGVVGVALFFATTKN